MLDLRNPEMSKMDTAQALRVYTSPELTAWGHHMNNDRHSSLIIIICILKYRAQGEHVIWEMN